MSPVFHASARHWLIGTALAFGGVAINRLAAPVFTGRTAAGVALLGELLGLAGLWIIAAGIRKRLRVAEAAAAQAGTPTEFVRSP